MCFLQNKTYNMGLKYITWDFADHKVNIQSTPDRSGYSVHMHRIARLVERCNGKADVWLF